MSSVFKMNLQGKPSMSYEEVVEKWHDRNTDKPAFQGNFLLAFVTSSNQIENIDVSYNTTRELFESEKVTNYSGDLRALFSVLNNKNVASYLNEELRDKTRVTPQLIREVHRLLMFGSMDAHRYEDNGERAGDYKRHDYCVGMNSVGSLPEDVPEDIQEICRTIQDAEGHDPLKVASIFQCEFEYVHPFADGNGRAGRWLTNYILTLGNHPPLVFYREYKHEYFDALHEFDVSGEYDKMYAYLKSETVRSAPALREYWSS